MLGALPKEYKFENGPHDSAVYLVVRPRVTKEMRMHERPPRFMYAPTAFYPPCLAHGRGSIGKALHDIAPDSPREIGIVVAVDTLATALHWFLSKAPAVHRGRQ
jgi:hypothetical protein